MEQQHENEREKEKERVSQRDLGTVGGGKAPDKGFSIGGMAATDSDVRQECDAENQPDTSGVEKELQTSPGGDNAVHQPQQGNLGGRNPGQPNKEIGDMDRPRQHDAGETASDPMTGRAPGQANKQ